MNSINTFGTEIEQFRNNNFEYVYSFNSVGNLFFKDGGTFNQTFLMLSGSRFGYDDDNIQKLLDLNFTEFQDTSVTQSVSTDFEAIANQLNSEVLNLQSLLLSAQVDGQDISAYVSQVNKDKAMIVSLRILLGQGKTEADFSDVFPYLPLIAPTSTSGSVSTTPTSSIPPVNPLAIYDTTTADGSRKGKDGSDGMLSAKEVANIQTQYKLGDPTLRNLVATQHNGIAPKKLSKTDLNFIIQTFYNSVKSIKGTTEMLKSFDVNNNKLLDKNEIKLIKQQFKVNNPVLTPYEEVNKKGKPLYNANSQLSINTAIYGAVNTTGSQSSSSNA